jgi:phosphonate transport system permease protein
LTRLSPICGRRAGLHLAEQIRVLEYQHVSAMILMILLVVAVIDFVSTRIRFAIIGRSEARR